MPPPRVARKSVLASHGGRGVCLHAPLRRLLRCPLDVVAVFPQSERCGGQQSKNCCVLCNLDSEGTHSRLYNGLLIQQSALLSLAVNTGAGVTEVAATGQSSPGLTCGSQATTLTATATAPHKC